MLRSLSNNSSNFARGCRPVCRSCGGGSQHCCGESELQLLNLSQTRINGLVCSPTCSRRSSFNNQMTGERHREPVNQRIGPFDQGLGPPHRPLGDSHGEPYYSLYRRRRHRPFHGAYHFHTRTSPSNCAPENEAGTIALFQKGGSIDRESEGPQDLAFRQFPVFLRLEHASKPGPDPKSLMRWCVVSMLPVSQHPHYRDRQCCRQTAAIAAF
jgi:hypothetical protein